jgi:glycine betaine/proline transport system substrate-binding protein
MPLMGILACFSCYVIKSVKGDCFVLMKNGGTMKKRIATILVLMLSFLLITSCAKKEPVKVVFGDAGWDSMKFHNAVAMFIAESAFNMETEEVSGSTAITYGGLKTGDIQVYMETWTDNIATYQEDVASGAVIELGLNYADNAQGFYVPRYVIEGDAERGIEPMAPDLKSVEDLAGYADVFADPDDPSKGRIYGAISGWSVDEIMRNKVAFYGLDEMYNYMDPGSDASLSAAISGAYEKGDPIVAYYWEPTWLSGKYDLVLLEDAPYDAEKYQAGETACPSVPLTVSVYPGFKKDNAEFCEFLSKYQTSSELTSEALLYIQDNSADYETAAKWFLTQHDELLSQWLSGDKADLVRKALKG